MNVSEDDSSAQRADGRRAGGHDGARHRSQARKYFSLWHPASSLKGMPLYICLVLRPPGFRVPLECTFQKNKRNTMRTVQVLVPESCLLMHLVLRLIVLSVLDVVCVCVRACAYMCVWVEYNLLTFPSRHGCCVLFLIKETCRG